MGTIPFGLRFLPEVQFDKPRKSDWLLDFERRSAEDALKSKPKVLSSSKPVAVLDRIYKKRGPAPKARVPILCIKGCGRTVGKKCSTGICRWCPKVEVLKISRPPVVKRDCKMLCGKKINSNNETGLCGKCLSPYRRTLKLGPKCQCKHPGCLEMLIRGNRESLCGWHNPSRSSRLPYRDTQPQMIATIGDAVNIPESPNS